MILLVDNYDSFSYNLYQQIGSIMSERGEAAPDIRIIRNDEASARQIISWEPSHVVISPGPGRPEDAGVCIDLISWACGRVPILGICLGHQAICAAFGARVSYAKTLMHGRSSRILLDKSDPLFRDLPKETEVGRYHSLAVIEETLPDSLRVTARADDGAVMAVVHRDYKIHGLQFHPESILTPLGTDMVRRFLSI